MRLLPYQEARSPTSLEKASILRHQCRLRQQGWTACIFRGAGGARHRPLAKSPRHFLRRRGVLCTNRALWSLAILHPWFAFTRRVRPFLSWGLTRLEVLLFRPARPRRSRPIPWSHWRKAVLRYTRTIYVLSNRFSETKAASGLQNGHFLDNVVKPSPRMFCRACAGVKQETSSATG